MSDFKGFIIFIIASILKLILYPIFLIYGIIKAIKYKVLGDYLKSISIGLDILGNITGKYILNDSMIIKKNISYGNTETISYTTAINDKINNLSKFGIFIKKILNTIDKNHLQKTLNNYGTKTTRSI